MHKKHMRKGILGVGLLLAMLYMGRTTLTAHAAASLETNPLEFDNHTGCDFILTENNKKSYAYCIQRGYPISQKVDELWQLMVTDSKTNKEYHLGEFINKNYNTGNRIFLGWGHYEYKSGKSGSGSPSDTQPKDSNYKGPSHGNYSSSRYPAAIMKNTKDPYTSTFKKVENDDWKTKYLNALSLVFTYLDESKIEDKKEKEACYRAKQALIWAVEHHKMYAKSYDDGSVGMIFNSDCESYIKDYIGDETKSANRRSMDYYRAFVWQMNNLRTYPSFAYDNIIKAEKNPITLYWDSSEQVYKATINDTNGVLRYFDFRNAFNIDGVSISQNDGNGTITIKSKNPITTPVVNEKKVNGEYVSTVKSTLLPEDCNFADINYYRWSREEDEKKEKNYKFAYLEKGSNGKYRIHNTSIKSEFRDWQDLATASGDYTTRLCDPVEPYIAIKTANRNMSATTQAAIQLIDKDGKEADYIIPGEKYKLRYTFTYTGGSKGFQLKSKKINTRRYIYNWNLRHYTLNTMANGKDDELKKFKKDKYLGEEVEVKNYYLDLAKTNFTMSGSYTTYETEYKNKTFTWNSNDIWNDSILLDAQTSAREGYPNVKSETDIKNSSNHKANLTVSKANNKITAKWTYDTEYQVFTSPICDASATISVGGNKTYVATNLTDKYEYAYSGETNKIGGRGYFTKKTVTLPNAENPSSTTVRTIWQTDVNIGVSDVVLNTGAGITQPVDIRSLKDMNYNLYYTINVTNDKAHKYVLKAQQNSGKNMTYSKSNKNINVSDKFEFDVNTLLNIDINGTKGSLTPVDHVSTGKTYIQRSIPAALPVFTDNSTKKASVTVIPNNDKAIYEALYKEPVFDESKKTLSVSFTEKYDDNTKSASNEVYRAVNPKDSKPYNAVNTNSYNNKTSYSLLLPNGKTATVSDGNTVSNYNEYVRTFNTGKAENKITFKTPRQSLSFYKYRGTSGDYSSNKRTQSEKYYISQVLFKSNATVKNQLGANKDGWVDMVNNNKDAIVAAGQGFELQVQVTYHNDRLTPYIARYSGFDNASAPNSSKVSSSVTSGNQYCNVSYLTGYGKLDRYSKFKVTGSNINKDLYVVLDDNPNTVYSYSGIYGTPQIYDLTEQVSGDGKTTTLTYKMKVSAENGVNSNYQTMKFYTDALAPDNSVHTLKLWTPVMTATGLTYPGAITDRYLGDIMELNYTVKSSMNDDSSSHIVQ